MISCRILLVGITLLESLALGGDLNRQSIVFYEETPSLFYCPQEKAISLGGMIVKAKPLEQLCEHGGKGLPEDYVSDCWNDVDETEYACQEKERILLKLKPPGYENAIIDNYVPIFKRGEYKILYLDSHGRPRTPKNRKFLD
eukprot:TRINITY_DN2944_c0_g1_i1.p1 TRINITY_DN2944_c0_g1~~TRINITY_DN2944_c0_g1_i1.p1  ORF type:complete len:142 (+),score=45.42 TRINITY_DN2944_c0_g1_i1:84-509(+)